MSYQEYMYNSERCQKDTITFNPPLKLKKGLSFKNVSHIPKVYRNHIIVPALDGILSCYNFDAEKQWEIKLSEKYIITRSYNGNIIIFNNCIYAHYDKKILTIDFETGKLLQSIETDNFRMNNSVLIYPFVIALFNNKNEFYYGALDLEKNKMIWTHPFNSTQSMQTLTGSNNKVIVYENKEEICCLEAKTGLVVWRSNLRDVVKKAGTKKNTKELEVVGTPMISGDNLYVAIDNDAHMACINMITGETRWATVLPIMTPSNATLYPDNRIYIFDNWVFIIIDSNTGKIIKKKNNQDYFFKNKLDFPTCMAVSDKTIYVADIDHGVLYGIDKVSLNVVWTHIIKSSIPKFPGPTIIDDMLFVLDTKNNLHVFEQA